MTKATVERHFHGEFGLEAELVDAKVMDPETKVIADPRRVLNCDETPQPIDAPQKGRRPKVVKAKGKPVRKAMATTEQGERACQHGVGPLWPPLRRTAGAQAEGAARCSRGDAAARGTVLRQRDRPRTQAVPLLHLLSHG